MTVDVDALFAGMKAAPMFGRGNYMAAGVYEVEIAKIFLKQSFKGSTLLICEFKIVTSTSEKHTPGSTGSWAPKLVGEAASSTWADTKSLILAAMGVDSNAAAGDADAQGLATIIARAVCGSESARAELKAMGVEDTAEALVIGKRVHLECTATKTRPRPGLPEGGDFTRYTWSPSVQG